MKNILKSVMNAIQVNDIYFFIHVQDLQKEIHDMITCFIASLVPQFTINHSEIVHITS